MVVNRQGEIWVDLAGARDFVRRLRRALRLGRRDFNVCFVGDRDIARLNKTFRGKARRTDVLSFPWRDNWKLENGNWKLVKPNLEIGNWKFEKSPKRLGGRVSNLEFPVSNFQFPVSSFEFQNFLGDIVISAPTARRNAHAEGHSIMREIRWLILHGVLHLLGYDHTTDHGEMVAFEHDLRARLRT